MRHVNDVNNIEWSKYFWYDGEHLYKISKRSGKISHKTSGDYSNIGYIMIRHNGKTYAEHRVIWRMEVGKIPSNCVIDHINGIRDDNRIDNLRLASSTLNAINREKKLGKASSKFKGVTFIKQKRKWQAMLGMQYSSIHLGFFDCEEAAALAYDDAVIQEYGTFAKPNFPERWEYQRLL